MKKSNNFKEHCLLVILGVVLFWALTNYSLLIKVLSFILEVLTPVIIGISIAFIANVPMKAIEKYIFKVDEYGVSQLKHFRKTKRPISIMLTFLICVGIVVLVCCLIIPEIITTFHTLSENLPAFYKKTSSWLENSESIEKWLSNINLTPAQLIDKAKTFISDSALLVDTLTSTLSVATAFFSTILDFIIGLFFAIYMLAQKERLARQFKMIFRAFFKESTVQKIAHVFNISCKSFSNFLTGQFTEALILGSLCCIGMLIFGFDNAVAIGILVAVTALIPILGAFIGIAFGSLFICVTDFKQALWFIVFMIILQQVEGNLIYPKVVGQSVGLPSLWVLFAVTVGGNLYGIVGMFISVPICSVLYCLARELVSNRNSRKIISHTEMMENTDSKQPKN